MHRHKIENAAKMTAFSFARRLLEKNGAADRTRTYYPIITNDVLYLMSYSGFLLFPRPYYGPTNYCSLPRTLWFCKSFSDRPPNYE